MTEVIFYVAYLMVTIVFIGALIDHPKMTGGEVVAASIFWPITIALSILYFLGYCLFAFGQAIGRSFL